MPSGSGKRTASTPPSSISARPAKRQERCSSPEEGELDDADHSEGGRARSPRPSAAADALPATRYSVKVKLPFKKKTNLPAESILGAGLTENPKGGSLAMEPGSRPVLPERPAVDSWEPDGRAERSRDDRQAAARSWKGRSHNGEPSFHDRDFPDRRWEPPRSGSPPGSPDRGYRSRGRSRARARSPSGSSPRSSSGSRSSSRKRTHRLPPHRSIKGSPTPPHPRRRDGTPDSRDQHDRFDSYPHPRYDPINNWRRDGRGQYRREPPEDYHSGDYYNSPRPPNHDNYDRDREGYFYVPRYESSSRRPEINEYRPVSPLQTLPRRPRSPSPYSPRTPPQPRSPPPLPPSPPLSGLPLRSAIPASLPKKPLAATAPSPPLIPLQPTQLGSEEPMDGPRTSLPVKPVPVMVDKPKENPQPSQPARPPRPPLRRTRDDEYKAYGRTFIGSGQQDDYDAMTKLGEGTFGEVHKAKHRPTGRLVALKRILMHNEREGMPVTALREIKILKALMHPNVVELLDMFVVRSNGKEKPLSVYMVFPYMDHDLAGLLENDRVKLQPSQIKLYMKQLLEGTEYMHKNHILHRDMKAANLLISNNGSLRIADFGLARSFDHAVAANSAGSSRSKERRYTNCVVTRWYRPPELLLGARNYGGEIDMWGVGCVLGEMFLRHPILPGNSDLDQLEKIWQMCGTPNQHTWPNFDTLPGCEGVKHHNQHPKRLRSVFEAFGAETCDLIDRLLTCNPRERISALQALEHEYFWTDPLPADPKTLPVYEASHEFDKRGRRQQPPQAPMPPTRPTELLRLPPPPTVHNPPLYFGRNPQPPTRESFRAPPIPPNARSGFPPHPYSQPPDQRTGAPMSLPPIHYPAQGPPPPAPYQHPNGSGPWDIKPNRAPHLPPRPSMPMGIDGRPRGGGRDGGQRGRGERDRDYGNLNYG